jgi:hypothetical protein
MEALCTLLRQIQRMLCGCAGGTAAAAVAPDETAPGSPGNSPKQRDHLLIQQLDVSYHCDGLRRAWLRFTYRLPGIAREHRVPLLGPPQFS